MKKTTKKEVWKDTSPVKASMPISPMGLGIQQQKGWEDLNDSEKIERLREIVKNQANMISGFHQTMEFLRDTIFKHSHGENNKIMMEAPRYPRSGIEGGSNSVMGHALVNVKPYF